MKTQYEPGLRRARRNVLAALDELAAIGEAMPNNDAGMARANATRACVAAKQALDTYLDHIGTSPRARA